MNITRKKLVGIAVLTFSIISSGARARYLAPEPMLQSPYYVHHTAELGMSVPTYAYALNNPLAFADSNGLDAYLVNCGGNIGHTDVYIDNACYEPESNPNRTVVGGGFYCAGYPNANNAAENLACVFAAPGEWQWGGFETTDSLANRCNSSDRLSIVHIPLTCEQTAEAYDRMQAVAKSPPLYSAGANNCHSVAQDIALGNNRRCVLPENGPFRAGRMQPMSCPR